MVRRRAVRNARPGKEETEGKVGLTERRKGLHIGDDGQKGTGKRLGKMSYLTTSGYDRNGFRGG